jgi:hypothetical protein
VDVRPPISVLLAVVVTGLAMVACGGGDDASTTATELGSVTEPTDAQPSGSVVADATATTAPTTTAPTTTAPTTTAPTTTAPTTTEPATTEPPVSAPLFDFGSGTPADGWGVVNDTVMGGVSSGQLALTDGVLVFTGDLSLDNNGGFASIRSPAIDPQRAAEWAAREGPRIRVDGDGRTWTVEVRTDDVDGGWIASLPTTPDGTTDTELPWSAFEPVTRFLDPRDTDVPLDPARIVSIALYLVDGIEGPFTLGVRSIG